MGPKRVRDQRGQASPEWLALVLVVSLAFFGLVAAGVQLPGAGLAKEIAAKLICAANLGAACDDDVSALTAEYGPEIANLIAEHTPVLDYEEGMRVLPIDWRSCRENSCAEGADAGLADETAEGLPVTLFTHVVDCRDPAEPKPSEADCSDDARGKLYLQYWAYYPDSRTAPFDAGLFGNRGYHPDDWESFQVRIGGDEIVERASSHHGYNGNGGDPLNDTGWFGGKSAWTHATGRYWISAGSHAGRVGSPPPRGPHGSAIARQPHRWTPARDVRLVPLESMRSEWGDYVGSPDHLPAWLKDVYLDPEATGTSG